MKKRHEAIVAVLCALGILACVLYSAVAHASDPFTAPWHRLPPDKRLHAGIEFEFGAEFALFMNAGFSSNDPKKFPNEGQHVLFRFLAPALMSFSFGVGKELMDEEEYLYPRNPAWDIGKNGYRRHEGWSAEDLAADAIGATSGAAIGALVGHGLGFTVRPICVRWQAWEDAHPGPRLHDPVDGVELRVVGTF